MPAYNKQLRLPATEYLGRRTYFVTICTENRSLFFSDLAVGRRLIETLLTTASRSDFTLHAYCVMPDHLHFLSEGRSDDCNLVKFVDGFKQRTAYHFSQTHQKRLWQHRYYDHILRPNEAIEDVACYIWWNPVRKNLCANPCDYPLSGSQTLDWMKHSSTPTKWQPPCRGRASSSASEPSERS